MGAPLHIPHAPMTAALRALLPSEGQTLLLCAALDTEQGTEAWATWRTQYPLQETLASDRVGVKGLLPLLAYALEQRGATVAPDDLSLLRMARYRESLRSERYQEILRQALTVLQVGGVTVLLLKGAALANHAYPHPALRHSHDIDVLIQPEDVPRAITLLLAKSFRHHAPDASAMLPGSSVRLNHASGLPLELHTHLFRNAFVAPPLAEAWQSARPIGAGLPGLMLAPEWELVHILGAVICAPVRARVTWVCDAHYLMRANPTLDWGSVADIAAQSHLTLAAAELLGYLQQQHQMPVPSSPLTELQRLGKGASRAEVEQLLQSARTQQTISYGDLWATATNWRERAWLLRWMLLPLPAPDQATRWQRPRFYGQRVLRYLARKAALAKPST